MQRWEIHTSDDVKFEIHPEGDSEGLHVIADVYESREFAELIKAAPDLLAACEAVVYRWEHPGEHPAGNNLYPEIIGDLRAAIATARGEAVKQ